MERNARRARPALEGLEERRLLNARQVLPNGQEINDRDLARAVSLRSGVIAPLGDKRIEYTTPQGVHVILSLYGIGSLAGTAVGPDGALNLVFNGTNSGTAISARVIGHGATVPLATVHGAGTPPTSTSGVGTFQVGTVDLKDFDLVSGGTINLLGGVGRLNLNSAAADSQVFVRSLPVPSGTTLPSNVVFPTETLQFVTTGGGAQLTGVGGITSGASTAASSAANAASSAAASATTNAAATVVGGQLAGVGGLNVPGSASGTVVTQIRPSPPPGVDLKINHIRGGAGGGNLGPAQIFGFDPQTNTLLRFDTASGAVLMAAPVPGMHQFAAGVSLAEYRGHTVALVADASTVFALDATTGAPVGQFTTANIGFTSISGLAESETHTIITDTPAGTNGMVRAVDVAASLAAGRAVPVSAPFTPGREFQLAGGATGVAGTPGAYVIGAAHFDPFQPDKVELGIMALNASGRNLTEVSRTALPGPAVITAPLVPGSVAPIAALGSIGSNLALVTSTANGVNSVTLYNPATLAQAGTVTLAYPGQIAGLSESFHPELDSSVLVDVRGTLRSLRGTDARGLVVNDQGVLWLIQIGSVADSTFVGQTVAHVNIQHRRNVTILSTNRPPATGPHWQSPPVKFPADRGGVTIVPLSKLPNSPITLP